MPDEHVARIPGKAALMVKGNEGQSMHFVIIENQYRKARRTNTTVAIVMDAAERTEMHFECPGFVVDAAGRSTAELWTTFRRNQSTGFALSFALKWKECKFNLNLVQKP